MENNTKRALVLIPCSKQKRVAERTHSFVQALPGLQSMRHSLSQLINRSSSLARRPENKNGILNRNAPLVQARSLYTGQFYRVSENCLKDILKGRYPLVDLLTVSAFYGLVKLDEGLREYELKMADILSGGMKVYQFWQRNQLWKMLDHYVSQNQIRYIWSLLPNSMPLFPYQQVLTGLWKKMRNTSVECYHVRVPMAGTSTGRRRAQWLVDILRTNPNQLIGRPFPPEKLDSIPGYRFNYFPC